MSAVHASYWLWGVWYATWWVAALRSAKVKARPAGDGGFIDRLLVGFGTALLFVVPVGGTGIAAALWRAPAWLDWTWVALVVLGFAFCWWARLHLGTLWSGFVTVKADHRIVDSGPYGLVRHPIYTGLILSAICEGLLKASPCALAGAVLIGLGFGLTARKEERFLRQQLGPDAYDAYARRVGMLAPRPIRT